jgi:hypothetical protein
VKQTEEDLMRTKQVLVTGGLAAGVLLLAGCMSMEGDLTFDDQARADGQLSIAINKQAASLGGIASLDAFEKAMAEDSEGDSVLGGGKGEIAYTETDTDYVATASFQDVDLNTDDDAWKAVIAEDGNLEFAYVNEAVDMGDLGGEDSDFGRFDLTVNFPGEVIEFSGEGSTKVDEDTIRWQFPISKANTISATSAVEVGMPLAPVIIAGAALGLLALGGAGAWAWRRRGSAASDSAALTASVEDATVAKTNEDSEPAITQA